MLVQMAIWWQFEDILSDLPPKARASATNGDDLDEKAKAHVVEQKGSFKVTSGNVDLEKVSTQQISRPTSPLPSPSGPVSGSSLFVTLQSAFQANIQQRECILTLMKQVTAGEITAHRASDVGTVQANNYTPEKSSLESAFASRDD